MVDEESLPEDFFDCGACAYGYEITEQIREATGDVDYFDRALVAFAAENRLERYGTSLSELDAIEVEGIEIVRSERAMMEAQRAQQSNKRNSDA